MSNLDLEPIKERLGKASEGPWRRHETFHADNFVINPKGFLGERGIVCGANYERDNAEFIAHAREDIPALIEEVEYLRGQVEWLSYGRKTLEEWKSIRPAFEELP